MVLRCFRYRFVCIVLLSIATIIFIGNLYYKSVKEISTIGKSRDGLFHSKKNNNAESNKLVNNHIYIPDSDENQLFNNEDNYIAVGSNECIMIDESNTTIKTVDTFSNFEFDAEWVKRRKGIWQNDFELRYESQMKNNSKLPLKVFIIPHSHNDPGWLQTFTGYYQTQTSKILNLVVEKLMKYEDMKFIWTEISFLDLWWSKASENQRKAFKHLVTSGRLEIMTGGWVMTDEANVHLYAMLDQLIEGHQWVKSKLDVSPKIGWSIDPFGQGSTVPHLLAKSGFSGAIIQRIHYNWKEWFARHQSGDFLWQTLWSNQKSSEYTLLTHNMPFDIYSTRHSCGPNPKECDAFDYEHKPSSKKMDVKQIMDKSDILVEQYSRTASLFPHNVAMVLMGSDFTFQDERFFEDHYFGYKPIIDFINENSHARYHGATVQYGTPSDYFKEIRKRLGDNFPSLSGDFFPYSDIFSSGVPAYWTGYFTTRPFHKFMSRDLEHNLRTAEILFTLAFNKFKQINNEGFFIKEFHQNYGKIVEARRNLGLFQHHDAITGTSKLAVMKDYLQRLYASVKDVINIQQVLIEFLLQSDTKNVQNYFIEHEQQREDAEEFPTQKVIKITKEKDERIVIFNSLIHKRMEVISVLVSSSNVRITNSHGIDIPHQINPVFDKEDGYEPSVQKFQLLFLVNLSPLSLNVFNLKYDDNSKVSKISCKMCKRPGFEYLNNSIEIENTKMRLIFNAGGFLDEIKLNKRDMNIKMTLEFGAYKSAPTKSGAYLFKPKDLQPEEILSKNRSKIFIIEGPIATDVTVISEELLVHTIRIFNTETHLDDSLSINNVINFESPPSKRDVEMIMKLKTSIKNHPKNGEPEFFTDQNGFQWIQRRKTPQLDVEGNYYPITSSVFIQDESVRLTLATTHAQGVTSMKSGELEIMLDRRTSYDDGRGMGEGVLDSVKMQHKFLLTLETFEDSVSNEDKDKYQVPSLYAHHLINSLNYPTSVFFIDSNHNIEISNNIELLSYKFACDMHLVNLRSLTDNQKQQMASQSSLLIIHRLGYDCRLSNERLLKQVCSQSDNSKDIQLFRDIKISKIQKSSLTALKFKSLIEHFNDKTISPMEIKTYLITYR